MYSINYIDSRGKNVSCDYAAEFGLGDDANTGGLFTPNLTLIRRLEEAGRRMSFSDGQKMQLVRAVGVYRYKTAEGRLEKSNFGAKDTAITGYALKLTFDKLEDGQELYDMIFGGKIQPIIPYETPQTPFHFPSEMDQARIDLALCIASNLTLAEIAERLNVSRRTLDRMIQELKKSYGAKDRLTLVLAMLKSA